jgi:glycoside/pentoside/hexuronide:cation symporter, GPH family
MAEISLEAVAPAKPDGKARRRFDFDHLTNWQLIAFALPALPLMALQLPVGFLLPPFYTGELGISLTDWGLIILVARLWDAATDPFVGILCDRLPSRWGRRRHWIVASIPLLIIGAALLFLPQLFTAHVTPLYVLAGMLVINMGTTLLGLNSVAWGGELSDDYHERTRIMAWRGAISAIAPLVALMIPAAVEITNPTASTGFKVAMLGWGMLALIPVAILLSVFSVGERAPAPIIREKGPGIWVCLREMFTNPLLLRVVGVLVLYAVPISVLASMNVFYVSYVLKAPGISSSLILIPLLSSMLSVPIWARIAKGREKHRVIACGYVVMACVHSAFLFLGRGDVLPYAVLTFALGLCSGTLFLMQSIMADVVDSDTIKTGVQRTGTFFAVMETMAKLAPSLAVTALFPFLQFMGFDPSGKHNTAASIDVVKYCFSLAPTIPILIGAALMWNFPLGVKRQRELRAEIDALRAGTTLAD